MKGDFSCHSYSDKGRKNYDKIKWGSKAKKKSVWRKLLGLLKGAWNEIYG